MDNETKSNTDVIDLLRRFHYGEPAAAANTTLPEGAVLPALLNAYRDASAIRYQYPLYLVPPDGTPRSVLAKPVSEYFSDSLEELAPDADDARILKDNLPWIERYFRQELNSADPVDAIELFTKAAAAMLEQLDVEPDNHEKLQAELDRLKETLAPGGQFLSYGPSVPLHLLLHAIRHRHERSREELGQRIDQHIHGLRSLLDIEKAKSGKTVGVGPGSQHFDAGALSGMLEQRTHGSVEMSAERRLRIEEALQELQAWQNKPVLVRIVGQVDDPWFAELPDLELIGSDTPCATASEVFERDASDFAKLFAALRIAALEIDDHYTPAIHDSWFASFDWQAFSSEELQFVTEVVALVSADYLARDGLPSFSQLLGSRMPVHVLSWVRAYDNPAAEPGEDPFNSYRFELANFGIGHRQVVVAQTSAARYEDLLSGFVCALDSNRTSLHLVNRGTQTKTKQPLLDAWFVASAALESRAHPFILVNPDGGDHAAERVSFGGNPQAENDWPAEKLEYRSADGETTEMELAFTFADYALLMPALHEHFRMVPPGFESADLVPIDRYLEGDAELVDRAVPFVWAIDDQGLLLRLVVSRALVFACRDRLNYWHTLQELAGIRNVYVEEAIDRIVEEQRAAIEAEREQIQKEQDEQLESVREEAAGAAIGKLVDVLMGADISGVIGDDSQLATMPAAAPVPEPAQTEAATAAAVVAAEPEAEEETAAEPESEEPWLETERNGDVYDLRRLHGHQQDDVCLQRRQASGHQGRQSRALRRSRSGS
jgi:hypothetical protein